MEITLQLPDSLGKELKEMPDFEKVVIELLQQVIPKKKPQKKEEALFLQIGDDTISWNVNPVETEKGAPLASDIIIKQRQQIPE